MARKGERRILRDLSTDGPILLEEGIYLAAEPNNLYNIHFVFPGPKDTKQFGGLFHGMLRLNDNHPFGPPSIYLLTDSGRFTTSKYPPGRNDRGICTSMSSYHPESWVPTWTLRSIIIGLISYMSDSESGGLGLINDPGQKKYAKKSLEAIKNDPIVQELFPELIELLNNNKWEAPKQ